MTHLWTGGGEVPQEYVDMVLCRDVCHCPPSVLDGERNRDLMNMLTMHLTEKEVISKRREQEAAKAKPKGSKGGKRGWFRRRGKR
jgi:hypothetical protein